MEAPAAAHAYFTKFTAGFGKCMLQLQHPLILQMLQWEWENFFM